MSKKNETKPLKQLAVMHSSHYEASPTTAKIKEEFKAYMVAWKCQKGHTNFQTIIGKEGTQHDICLKCCRLYEYVVERVADTRCERWMERG